MKATSDRGSWASKGAGLGVALFSITVKNQQAARRTHFVSPATHSIHVEVKGVNGVPPSKVYAATVALTASNHKACKSRGSTLACRFKLRVPTGRVEFGAFLYASTNGSGPALSSAVVTAKIKAHATTHVPMVPSGIPATIVASVPAISAIDDGTTHTASFSVSAEDASGATIIGPGRYQAPLQVYANGDTQGALSFSPSQIASPSSGSSTVTVNYDSAIPLTQAQIVIEAQGATSATVAFSAMSVSPGSLNGFLLGDAGQTQTITLSEPGFAGPFALSGVSAAVGVTCAPATCAPASDGGSVQMTFTPQAAGSGTIAIADGMGTSAVLPYRVSQLTNYNAIASSGAVTNLVAGPDGNLWAVVQSGGSGEIVRATTTGGLTPYPLPSPFDPATSPDGVAGSDGAIWLVDGATPYVYRVSTSSPTTGAVTAYATSGHAVPTSIALAPGGQTLYVTDTTGGVQSIGVQTHTMKAFTNPYAGYGAAESIAIDSSGNVYFVANSNAIRMTPNGTFTQLPGPKINPYTAVYPNVLTIGPDGNLWDGTPYGYLCAQSTSGTTVGCYANALTQTMSTVATGPDGAIWGSGATAAPLNALTRTTTAGVTTTYVPHDCCAVQHNIVIGSDGALWVASSTGGLDRIVP
jgi:hypothetical protein